MAFPPLHSCFRHIFTSAMRGGVLPLPSSAQIIVAEYLLACPTDPGIFDTEALKIHAKEAAVYRDNCGLGIQLSRMKILCEMSRAIPAITSIMPNVNIINISDRALTSAQLADVRRFLKSVGAHIRANYFDGANGTKRPRVTRMSHTKVYLSLFVSIIRDVYEKDSRNVVRNLLSDNENDTVVLDLTTCFSAHTRRQLLAVRNISLGERFKHVGDDLGDKLTDIRGLPKKLMADVFLWLCIVRAIFAQYQYEYERATAMAYNARVELTRRLHASVDQLRTQRRPQPI